MSSTSLLPWQQVRGLFDTDDGSLPDVYVENLTPDEVVAIYEWAVTQGGVPKDKTVWRIADQQELSIFEVNAPAREFVNGVIAGFRHRLEGLAIDGCVLPLLTISLEDDSCVSFDYRKGHEWDNGTINAFLMFLSFVHELAPGAHIWQTDEGGSEPTPQFDIALKEFEQQRQRGRDVNPTATSD